MNGNPQKCNKKTPLVCNDKRRSAIAVPLFFITQKAGNGAEPGGVCIPLAPGRTFPRFPAGRLAVDGLPSLSGFPWYYSRSTRDKVFNSNSILSRSGKGVKRKRGPCLYLASFVELWYDFPAVRRQISVCWRKAVSPFFPGVKTFFSPPSLPRKGVSPWLLMRNCFSIPW